MKKSQKTIKKRTKRARKIVPIMGISLDSTQAGRVITAVRNQAQAFSAKNGNARPWLIVTPNPEILLQAQIDPEFARILNAAQFALPDGRGLALAARFLKGQSLEILPGRIIAQKLVEIAREEGWRVFFLGGRPGVAEQAALAASSAARARYPSVIRSHPGPQLNESGIPIDEVQRRVEERVVRAINKLRPQLLFVGFGAPKQEKWLSRNLPRLKVGVAMTVGGTLDYWAGKTPLPPPLMEKLGLEWLWRVLVQPRRLPRIFRATVVFPLKVIRNKLIH